MALEIRPNQKLKVFNFVNGQKTFTAKNFELRVTHQNPAV